ncbi:MAG: hypothetical protein ABIH46_09245 [Chloroflexota bacterium]
MLTKKPFLARFAKEVLHDPRTSAASQAKPGQAEGCTSKRVPLSTIVTKVDRETTDDQ